MANIHNPLTLKLTAICGSVDVRGYEFNMSKIEGFGNG